MCVYLVVVPVCVYLYLRLCARPHDSPHTATVWYVSLSQPPSLCLRVSLSLSLSLSLSSLCVCLSLYLSLSLSLSSLCVCLSLSISLSLSLSVSLSLSDQEVSVCLVGSCRCPWINVDQPLRLCGLCMAWASWRPRVLCSIRLCEAAPSHSHRRTVPFCPPATRPSPLF